MFFQSCKTSLAPPILCNILRSIFDSVNLHFVNYPSIPPSFDFMFLRLNN